MGRQAGQAAATGTVIGPQGCTETKTPPSGRRFCLQPCRIERGESASAQTLLKHAEHALNRVLIALYVHHAAAAGWRNAHGHGSDDVPGLAVIAMEQAMEETALLLGLRGDHAVHPDLVGHRAVVARTDRAHAAALQRQADAVI